MNDYYQKNILISLVLLLFGIVLNAQNIPSYKSTLYTSAGAATFPDMTRSENGFVIGLGYRRKLSNSFSAELFLQRISANSTLTFFENKEVLSAYLIENDIGIPTDFGKIATNCLGAKLHLSFVDKGRHFFSFALGYGFYWSQSTIQRFKEFSTDQNGEITDFEVLVDSESRSKAFILPSLLYTFNIYKNFGLGLELSTFFEQSSEGLITTPVIPNYYSVNLMLFKSF